MNGGQSQHSSLELALRKVEMDGKETSFESIDEQAPNTAAVLLTPLTSGAFYDACIRLNNSPILEKFIRMKDPNHHFSTVLVGNWGLRKNVIMKDTAYSNDAKDMMIHEAKVAMMFEKYTAGYIGMEPIDGGKGIRIGFKYYPNSLARVMEKADIETEHVILEPLFNALHAFEEKDYLLNDLRVQTFRVEECKYYGI